MDNSKPQNILILGLGKSGKSLAQFFSKRGCHVLAYDDRIVKSPICTVVQNIEQIDFSEIDLVATSPGVKETHPIFLKAKEHHIPIKGEMQIGLESITNTCLGITGTNGKSTLCALLAHILNATNRKARAVGNIGIPLTSIVDELEQDEILVVELSSYQIDSLAGKHLDCAVILNITPDHLDRYHTFENYAASKWRIRKFLKERGQFLTHESVAKRWKVSLDEKTELYAKGDAPNYEKDRISLLKSILSRYNLSEAQIISALKTFKGLEHRFEKVDDINQVQFINDSKATNIESVAYALEKVSSPVHIIMGGDDKGLDYTQLLPSLKSKAERIYLIGESKEKMAKVFEKEYTCHLCSSLKEATTLAFEKSNPNEMVLLSPGTSSFDQFDSFEHRGTVFKQVVKMLKGEKQ